MELHEWVKAARKHAGLTQDQLAEQLAMTKGNISGWENARHSPSFEQVARVAQLTGYALPQRSASALPDEPEPEYMGVVKPYRRIPVVGTAKLGHDGHFEEFSSVPGAGDGSLEMHSDDPHAYCLRVRGMSMHPAIRDGWYVIVEPNGQIREGEYVMLKLRDGSKMVKELLFRRHGSIQVMSVNGDERFSIDEYELEGIQAVAAVVSPSKWRPE